MLRWGATFDRPGFLYHRVTVATFVPRAGKAKNTYGHTVKGNWHTTRKSLCIANEKPVERRCDLEIFYTTN